MKFLGGAATPSPPARGSEGVLSFPSGFGAEPQLPKGFPLFSALRMASPDTIIFTLHAKLRRSVF